ncbi:hypothetical protein [Streptomyces goshikiensis]|uniref:hypothetical protein n=1 Tax=Streptomyces goshikiensis TaxID=1942 RepID=UPI003696CD13
MDREHEVQGKVPAREQDVVASGARIKIAPDTTTTVNDLNHEDFSDAKNAATEVWSRRPGSAATDLIRFNKARMDLHAALRGSGGIGAVEARCRSLAC